MMLVRTIYRYGLLVLSVLLCGCSESSNLFCSLPANFTFDNIYQAPQLYAACNSMGEFCTIRGENNRFLFSNTQGTTPINQSALSHYSGFYLGLSGFIVGLPNIPEMGQDASRVVCFDLACANCYQDYNVCKRMTLQEGGYARCSSCQRLYDLNNLGIVAQGQPGRTLYRYRVSYVGNSLIIRNR